MTATVSCSGCRACCAASMLTRTRCCESVLSACDAACEAFWPELLWRLLLSAWLGGSAALDGTGHGSLCCVYSVRDDAGSL